MPKYLTSIIPKRIDILEIWWKITPLESKKIYLRNDKRSLPSEDRLVEQLELQTQFAHVICYSERSQTNEKKSLWNLPERVRQSGEPVDDFPIGVGDHALTELVLPVLAEIQNSANLKMKNNISTIQKSREKDIKDWEGIIFWIGEGHLVFSCYLQFIFFLQKYPKISL